MAYTNRTIRLDFPELGDDIWVVINNPLLMPISYLQSNVDIKLDENNRPTEPSQAVDASLDIASRMVLSWNVYDPMDTSEEPVPFEMPATVEKLRRLPLIIVTKISEIVGKALNPTS